MNSVCKKVLLIGDLPLGSKVLKLFQARQNQAIVVGVLCQKPMKKFRYDPFEEKRSMYQLAKDLGIPTFHSTDDVLEQFQTNGLDIGISCRASIIYPKTFIDLFDRYFINLHGGILPLRAGVNIACHSILEGDAFGGGTLHIIEEEVDTGAIIARRTFPIRDTDTALDVYRKTQTCLFTLVQENLDDILAGTLAPVPQSKFVEQGESRRYFNRHALAPLKRIDLTKTTPREFDRIVRGCDFPGHEPAYVEYEGKRIYLTTRRFFERE